VWVVGALIAAGVVGLAIQRASRPTAPVALPSSPPSASASPATASTCGDVELPVIDVGPAPTGTRLRLLVGDRDLRVVDVDAGTTRQLTSPAQLGRAKVFSSLARRDGRVFAVVSGACGGDGLGEGHVVEVDPTTGRLTPAGRGDEILPGTPATALEYDAPNSRWLVRRLAGGRATALPADQPFPLAAAGSSYVLAVAGRQRLVPPTIGLGDAATGRLTRSFGTGNPVAASEHGVFWTAGDCLQRCLLTHTELAGVDTAQSVRAAPCCGTVSPDGRWLAFRLPRTTGRLGPHPGPPSEVAVLDSLTGYLQVLPGLLLPAKAPTTLAWSADSRWLAIGADLGTAPLVLLWHEGMERPARVPVARPTGGTAGAPALVVLAR